MKQLTFLLLIILFSAVASQMLEQTDWSVGTGQMGHDYWFNDTF